MDRLRAWNESRPVTIVGTLIVLAVMGALILMGHGQAVTWIGGICGVILLFQHWYRNRETG